jgi:hypothetical protein
MIFGVHGLDRRNYGTPLYKFDIKFSKNWIVEEIKTDETTDMLIG